MANQGCPLLELEDVSVVRGGRLLWSDSSLAVPRGSTVAIIGPNGAGKTTMLQLVLGLVAPNAGRVAVFGAPPRRGNHRIGYVPQNYSATVGNAVRCRDLVALGISGTRWGVRRLSASESQQVERALSEVGAASYATRRMSELSGGQQQRVAIARALVGDPELLLLDEPLANLDLRNQYDIVALLGRLQQDRGITILVVTHDLNPLLSIVNSAVYLLDEHAHFAAIGDVVDSDLLTHLYGTPIKVVKTAQGDLFTRSA
jgi:zinc/manganese transport system ATP-binding protein